MYVAFENLPKNSKIWVYQSERTLKEEEIAETENLIHAFLETWETHGKPIKGSFKIFFKRYIIIAVDSSYITASGCSIDKSVELMQHLESNFQVSLLDRSIVGYKSNGEINVCRFSDIKSLINQGIISENTLIFDNSIQELSELDTKWQVSAKNTWTSKYFNN